MLKNFLGFTALLVFAVESRAQTLPAGLVYQAAAQVGIEYIEPTAGQAIVNQKAALNWKNILAQALSDGPLAVLTGGLAGVIHLDKAIEIGLAVGHSYYDRVGAPLLAQGAPTPGSIAPVLPMSGTLTPSATSCAEASMYAVFSKVNRLPGPVMVQGLSVTFTPQGSQVVRNVSGQRIKGLQVIDVLACVPASIVLPAKTAESEPVINRGWPTEAELAGVVAP